MSDIVALSEADHAFVANVEESVLNLSKGQPLSEVMTEEHVKHLCSLVQSVLMKDEMLVRLSAPVWTFGSLLGRLETLRQLLDRTGTPATEENKKFLFLGDYVDYHGTSLEVLALLFSWKLRYAKRVVLLRGGHELAATNRTQGFLAECLQKYGRDVYRAVNVCFTRMPIAAVIDDKILGIRGCIPQGISSLDDLNLIARPYDLTTTSGLIAECLFNAPTRDETVSWAKSPIGIGKVLSPSDVAAACKTLKFDLVVRTGNLVNGLEVASGARVVTIFSSGNYRDAVRNDASALLLTADRPLKAETIRLPPPSASAQFCQPFASCKDETKAGKEAELVKETLSAPIDFEERPERPDYKKDGVTVRPEEVVLRSIGDTITLKLQNGSGRKVVFHCKSSDDGCVKVEPEFAYVYSGRGSAIRITRTGALVSETLTVQYGEMADTCEDNAKVAALASVLQGEKTIPIKGN